MLKIRYIIAEIYTEIVTPLLREAYLVGLRDAKEASKAADQIPDLIPEKISTTTRKTKAPKMETSASSRKSRSSREAGAPEVVGEEKLKSNKEKSKDKENGNKSSAARRKHRSRLGLGTELSPLVRRRDGSFAFRNRDLEKAKAELSRQRKECVRDALFKHLDSDDSLVGIPKGSMTKL